MSYAGFFYSSANSFQAYDSVDDGRSVAYVPVGLPRRIQVLHANII
jgi:hypothetical protein